MKKLMISIQRTDNLLERTFKASPSATYSPATHLFLFFSPGQNLAAAAATRARVMTAVFMSLCPGVTVVLLLVSGELVVTRHIDRGFKYQPPAPARPSQGDTGPVMEQARVSRNGSEFQFLR